MDVACCRSGCCQDREPCRAWIALICTVLSNMLLNLSDSFGVYYDALVEKYEASRAAVGWIFSIRWIFLFISGIFISPLIDMCGCRAVAMTMAFVYATATALSALAPTIGSLYFIYSFLTGMADSGIYLAGVTAIQLLFSRNRGFASGMAALGFPIGVIIHPLHAQLFLDLYGVSGVFLMHGAISYHLMIYAFAFKTPGRLPKSHLSHKHDISHVSLIDDDDQVKAEAMLDRSGADRSPAKTRLKCHFLSEYFKRLLDFALLKRTSFVLTVVHYLLLWQIRLGLLTQIVSCAKLRGVPEHEASYLLSIAGLTNLAMTIVAALLMNTSWLNPPLFSGFASLCLACSAAGCTFSRRYGSFVASAAALGVADGIAVANLPNLVLYTVGLERFTGGMSLLWMLLTPAAAGSSPFVGWMVDMFGNYVAAFIILGIFGLISSFLTIVIVILRKRDKRRSQETVKDKEVH